MANYEFFGYSPDALVRDPATGRFTLDPDFSPSNGRVRFDIKDNDTFFDGDGDRDEVGEDSNQRATVRDGDGNQIAKGKVYVEEYGYLRGPDGSNTMVDIIEIDGQVMGYVTNAPLDPGTTYRFSKGGDVDDTASGGDTRLNYDYYEENSVVCFGPGTTIMTQDGEIPVEWLDTSDKVLTRDHAYQPILWVGRTKLTTSHFGRHPKDQPVRIPAESLGNGLPTHDLEVTGDHRILLRSAMAQVLFSTSEVFAPAKAWTDVALASTCMPEKTYTLTHILCQAHEVIMANGAWVESMFPGPEALSRLRPADRARIAALLGPEAAQMQTARQCLTRGEAVMLLRQQRAPAGEMQPLPVARSA